MFTKIKIWHDKHEEESKHGSITLTRLFVVNMKTVYSTTSSTLVVVFSPILVALALSVLFPINFSVGAGQIFVAALSAGTIWGMTFFSIRRSTFYDNLSMTKISNIGLYLSILATMLVVTAMSETTYWLSTIVFDSLIKHPLFDTMMTGNLLGGQIIEVQMHWLKVDWLTLMYSWFMSVLLIFASSFAFRGVLNTNKNYFIVLLVYILILIPFGGLVRPMIEQNSEGMHYKDLMPVQYLSMFFPQFHLNSFAYAAVAAGSSYTDPSAGFQTLGHIETLASFQWSGDAYWNFTILYPPVCVAGLMIIAYLTLHHE